MINNYMENILFTFCCLYLCVRYDIKPVRYFFYALIYHFYFCFFCHLEVGLLIL